MQLTSLRGGRKVSRVLGRDDQNRDGAAGSASPHGQAMAIVGSWLQRLESISTSASLAPNSFSHLVVRRKNCHAPRSQVTQSTREVSGESFRAVRQRAARASQ